MLLFSLHMEPDGLQLFSCSDVEIISPGLAISAFGLTLKASICLDTVMSSLQSNPRALSSQSLVFPGTQLSLLVSKALQAGKHHRAWRELRQPHGLLKRTTNQRVKRCLGSHIAQFPQAGNTKAPRGEGTGPRTAASPQDALYKLEMVPNWMKAVLGHSKQAASSRDPRPADSPVKKLWDGVVTELRSDWQALSRDRVSNIRKMSGS